MLLVFIFPTLLRSQPELSTPSPTQLSGLCRCQTLFYSFQSSEALMNHDTMSLYMLVYINSVHYFVCRSWLFPCGSGTWTCTTDEQYWRFRRGPQPGCPAVYPQTTAPPPGDCQMVDGTCQFTNDTLECTTWLNSCQGYRCGSTSEYNAFLASPGPVCPFGGQYPQPDDICLPINGSCQWYNPCRTWRGFCLSGYNCGTAAQYYQFIFGPQPICALPPPGWVEPEPPGDCAVRNGQCEWYSKFTVYNYVNQMHMSAA